MKKMILISVLAAIAAAALPATIVTNVTGPFQVNQRIGFNKTCHDGTLRPNCVWDWGDGSQTNVNNDSNLGWIFHAFQNPGTYLVRYTRSSFIGAAGAPQCGSVAAWSESLSVTVAAVPGQVTVQLAEITMDNGRSYKVVPKGSRNIQGILRLKMQGSGIVSGHWLVDDQPLEFFMATARQGEIKTIQTKAIPGLPTIQPGLHTLTVRLNRPLQPDIVFPVLKYFVLPFSQTIILVSPADGFVAKETEKPLFSWQPGKGASRYRIAFSNDLQRLLIGTPPPLDWIDTAERIAMTPDDKTWQGLLRDRPVYWKVRALDSLGSVLAESAVQEFKIIVPGASLTFTEVCDLDGKPLAVSGQNVRSKNAPILVKGRIRYMSDAAVLVLRVFVDQTLSDQLVIRDYRLGESRAFETSISPGPGSTAVEFQLLKSSSPSVIVAQECLQVIREN